jgi:hypothetical protein
MLLNERKIDIEGIWSWFTQNKEKICRVVANPYNLLVLRVDTLHSVHWIERLTPTTQKLVLELAEKLGIDILVARAW